MAHLTPNTTEATAKLLRTLAANFSTQSTRQIPRETYSSATTANSESLLTSLIPLLTSATPPQLLNNALQTLFNLSNTIPPSHLAPHWRTLCQRVLSLSKQAPQPRTLITLAALIIASIPLSALGTEQRAVVAAFARQSLQHAQVTLSQHPAQSLCLILAVIHGAPRELRAQALEERLKTLFSNPERKVRTLAATVSAELITCVSQKHQPQLFSDRVAYVQTQIEDALALLDAFTTGKYNGDLSDKSPTHVCGHLDAVCMTVVNLLDLSIRAEFPLRSFMKSLRDGMRERVIDPYTVVKDVQITHEDMLVVIPRLQSLCAQTIAAIAERIPRAALQMFVKDIGTVCRTRLSKLLLRSRKQHGLTSIKERRDIYAVISRLVSSLGTGFLDFCVPRLQELFEIDFKLYERCLSGEKVLKMDPESNLLSGEKSRKRRRHNGHRDRPTGPHVLTKEHVQGLASVYGKDTLRSVETTTNAALDVITRIFDCRGLLTREVRKHILKLERFLLEMLNRRKLSPMLLRAITSASLGGGSQRMVGEASSLLMPLARVSAIAALDTTLLPEERKLALAAKSGCEPVIHPSGPPYAKESTMYSTAVDNKRSEEEKHRAANDLAKVSELQVLKQDKHLSNPADTTFAEAKNDTAKVKRATSPDNSEDKSRRKPIEHTPANDLMEVDKVAEIRANHLEKEGDSSQQDVKKYDHVRNIERTEEYRTEKGSIHESDANGNKEHYPNTPLDKRIIEARRTEPAIYKEQQIALETTPGNAEAAQRKSVDDPIADIRVSGTKKHGKEERREDDSNANKTIDTGAGVNLESLDSEAEERMAKEDQALIDGLVFESSDEE